jgi:hypothetical protein
MLGHTLMTGDLARRRQTRELAKSHAIDHEWAPSFARSLCMRHGPADRSGHASTGRLDDESAEGYACCCELPCGLRRRGKV